MDEWNKAAADWAAQVAYQQSMSQDRNEQAALARATQAWKETMDRAGLTGMFEGSPTVPYMQRSAEMFGNWGTPTQGQQTLESQQQYWDQAYKNAQAYGQYYAPGTAPTQGQQTQSAEAQAQQIAGAQAAQFGTWFAPGSGGPSAGQQTQAAQQQAFAQQLAQQQEARAMQGQQQQTAQNYLQLLSQLRGPADWAKYQQVLGSTPQGMRDLTAAAMGQYIPGGGATTGVQPEAVSLQSMQQQVAGQGYGQPQQQWGQPQYGQITASPSGMHGMQPPQQTQQAYTQGGQMMDQRYQAQPGGGQVWGSGIGVGGQQPTPAQQQQGMGGGANTMGQMPAPNQVAAQSWRNLAPSQQQMMLGQWEAGGWDKNDVTALMNQALPRYGANTAGAGTWRLQ